MAIPEKSDGLEDETPTDTPPQSRIINVRDMVEEAIRDGRKSNEAAVKKVIPQYMLDLVPHIHIRLAGYDIHGNPADLEKDLNDVLEIERRMLIDPERTRADLKNIRDTAVDQKTRHAMSMQSSFAEGRHITLNTINTLKRIRWEGWILLMGIIDQNNSWHSLGYNYGLDSMPNIYEAGDPTFPTLDRNTLGNDKFFNPDNTMVNYRTSVLPIVPRNLIAHLSANIPEELQDVPVQRAGLGTAAKYHFVHRALRMGKEAITFNTAKVYDWLSVMQKTWDVYLLNVATHGHNTKFFKQGLGYRKIMTAIFRQLSNGKPDHIASAAWYAWVDEPEDVKNNMLLPTGPLLTRHWSQENLDQSAEIAFDILKKERERGDHA